jgi:hypothetical protein
MCSPRGRRAALVMVASWLALELLCAAMQVLQGPPHRPMPGGQFGNGSAPAQPPQ